MSYNNILKLAQKFSIKIAEEANNSKLEIQEYFNKFKSELRSVLNEMDGDLLTLRIKGADKNLLKSFKDLHQILRDKFKSLNDSQPLESIDMVLVYLFSKAVKTLLINLHAEIQKFLKSKEIDFTPHSGFSQVRVNSINNLLRLAYTTKNTLSQKSKLVETIPLKFEKEIYAPSTDAANVTKVEKK
jgi:hypothetical protein